jgi:hypothetical protein
MKIRVADAAGLHLDQHFIISRDGTIDISQDQRFLEFLQEGGFHVMVYLDERSEERPLSAL